jgi:topoisomerase IA-like protein
MGELSRDRLDRSVTIKGDVGAVLRDRALEIIREKTRATRGSKPTAAKPGAPTRKAATTASKAATKPAAQRSTDERGNPHGRVLTAGAPLGGLILAKLA